MMQEQDSRKSGRRDTVPVLYSRRVESRIRAGRVNLRSVAFVGATMGLIALAGALYLQQASRVASYAHEIRKLESQKERLRSEIMVLRAESAALGSLARVTIMGESLGYFVPSSSDSAYRLQVEYVTGNAEEAAEGAPSYAVDGPRGPGTDAPAPSKRGVFERLFVDLQDWLENGPSSGALVK